MKQIFTSIIFLTTIISAYSQTYNITFQLNTNEMTETFSVPEINGTFNNWCGACAPLADEDGDGIYTITIPLSAGLIEYKFAADNWAIQESLVSGSSCTLTTGQFINRVYEVTQDATLPIVCWGSCDNCGINNGPFNVTFKVDMSDVTEAYTTPEVNGTFNDWCGGCAPMTDADGDDIWELTIALPAGSHEYKFAYDSWAGQESLTAGAPCTITFDAFTNRFLEVSGPAELDPVCWGQCAPCGIISVEESNAIDVSIFPNPVADVLNISGLTGNGVARIVDMNGKEVMSGININSSAMQVNVSEIPAGNYVLITTVDSIQSMSRFCIIR
ncbi:MAG: T9SS type A sorting domain-containing protein [Flavobacteriales bacterium]|jgi:hypothetical protein